MIRKQIGPQTKEQYEKAKIIENKIKIVTNKLNNL